MAFIEFNPFQTTITRRDGARASDDSYINMLATDAEIFEIMKQDVRRGIRMFQYPLPAQQCFGRNGDFILRWFPQATCSPY